MKLRKIVSAALASLMLAGCSANVLTGFPPEPQIKSGFTAQCAATAYIIPPDRTEEEEFCFGGTLTRLGTGFWKLELSSPETLNGVVITRSDDVFHSELGELSFDTAAEDLPSKSPFAAIFSDIDKAAVSSEPLESGENGGWVLNTDTCTIVFDEQGEPVSMACSSPRMTVEFTDFMPAGTESSETAELSETSAETD